MRKGIALILIILGAILFLAWLASAAPEPLEALDAQEPAQVNVDKGEAIPQVEVEEPVAEPEKVNEEAIQPEAPETYPEDTVEAPAGMEGKDGVSITSEPDPIGTDLVEVEPEEFELPENPSEIVMPEEVEDSAAEDSVEISDESVDKIEDSLSVGDYAKGLSLLAQLPAETVDRFVELRKDGFTKEEQAEMKMILLASFEGEDLNWIVETYQKLQP